MKLSKKNEGIVIKSKQQYSCMQKVFCCRCFACFQEQNVMTSDIRKETIQRMIQGYLIQNDQKKILYDPVKLMILIYICNDDKIPLKHIENCKISPSTGILNYRTDLEFYIPQICNYIVFHRNLQDNYLKQAVQKISKINFYFAHLYLFYMRSIQKNIKKTEIQILRPVVQYNNKLQQELSIFYKSLKLSALDLYLAQEKAQKQSILDEYTVKVINDYETTKMQYGKFTKVKPEDIHLGVYYSIFQGEKGSSLSFQSTINFFSDLFFMCDDLKNHNDKKQKTIEYIKMINCNLPASVYVPFSKNSYKLCNVLKIVTSQVRVFSTKERAPVCLCIETYCPSQNLPYNLQNTFWQSVEIPMTIKINPKNKNEIQTRQYQQTGEFKPRDRSSINLKAANIMQQQKLLAQIDQQNQICNTSQSRETDKTPINHQTISLSQRKSLEVNSQSAKQYNPVTQSTPPRTPQKQQKSAKKYNDNTSKVFRTKFNKMFGEKMKQNRQRIRKNSVFGEFKTWDILYIIVKTHDDLKQEQFAMQLIYQMNYIFKLQKLPLILTPYQVLSLGPNCGIIEMVKESVTFDSLKKTLRTQFPYQLTLKQFFEVYYQDQINLAKQNFLNSLVAYSLVMYILQAKDRHNGNILLHRTGKIFHIDFGFFLSNMPGKGIQLQRDCPFKLLTEYIDVLDGVESHYFKKFRQLFFQGFKAIQKHQNKVLMLVKMMYSSTGDSMPCFSKGQATITAFESRINPLGIINDLLLNQHCQQIINLSIDNWASKWYDRFQYWAQGIFY